MNSLNLPLHTFKIPENINELLQNNDEMWKYDDFSPFNITISNGFHKGKARTRYQIDFCPYEEFDKLNQHIEGLGFEADGYGWTDYMLEYISETAPALSKVVFEDSETETCVLYVEEAKYFVPLLTKVEEAIKELAGGSLM